MPKNNSVTTPLALTCLASSQCTSDFLPQIENTDNTTRDWLGVYPVAAQLIKHFLRLPTPLLSINSQFWHTAKEVVKTCNSDNLPLLTLQNYDQQTLFGRINIDNDDIKYVAGEIENLKGGVLVLQVSPMLVTPSLWFHLKSFLLNQQLSIFSAVNSNKLRGPLPEISDQTINTKIVLVANRYQLDELTQIDPDLAQVNSLYAELSSDVKTTDSNIKALALFCNNLIKQQSLPPITDEALATLFLHLSQLCEHQKKILFSPKIISAVLSYAALFQSQSDIPTSHIEKLHLQAALKIQMDAQSNAQNFSDQALVEKQLNIQLQGKKIGQINGLSVVELMGYPTEFGEVFRISASDMIGDGEIIDVERKVELAGNIHAKSTLIVQGYLNHFFTHIVNFPLSCNVVFEQSYQESDGDSASLAILLAVSSCYSHFPIAQNLFVTGALDQHGNVLAIGGINQKIESITRLFTLGLLNEPVTVLMPKANQVNLMLNNETLQLIDENKIKIYTIQHCFDAFPFAMSHSFKEVIETINKRIMFLHKDEDEHREGFLTKCLNLLR